MKIPMKPPPMREIFESVLNRDGGNRYIEIVGYPIGPAPRGKYLHWDKLFHLAPPHDLTTEEWWLALKLARNHLYQELPLTDRQGQPFKYALFDGALRLLHEIDRDASGVIKGSEQVTSPYTRDMYVLKSLIEEAITSSQLEGAATTRKVAKEMLRTGRKPKDRSEQMIYNNYQAMLFIRDLGNAPLTPQILITLQEILTKDTLDDPSAAGRFRRADEPIQIVDEVGQLLHIPPDPLELVTRTERLCEFANASEGPAFLHPVIRAVLLHFQLAYDHPFVDGNGRTARTLFYWAMKTSGYWLCEFLSISRILKKAPAQYARSFLYTETDDSDVTYFILDQLRVIIRAIEELHAYLDRKTKELHETELLIRRSFVLQKSLNYRQLAVINHALKNQYFAYTFDSHRGSHNISYQTARTDLMTLADLGLLEKAKRGRAIAFLSPPDLRDRIAKIGSE